MTEKVKALIAAVMEVHADGGASQGYLPNGSYGVLDHACLTCGEHGEYGVAWPCPTHQLLSQALGDDQ
jgi:hypothetical protein